MARKILLLIETSKAYGRAMLEGIGQYAQAHGRWSLYVEERGLQDRQPRWLESWQGDGIIFRSYGAGMVDTIRSRGIPSVDTNSKLSGHGFPLVYTDEAAIAQMACEHFLERRFENLAFCTVEEEPWVEWRRGAYLAHLDLLNIPCHRVSAVVGRGRATWDRQLRQISDWVAQLPKPIGIFAANDICGLRLIDACRSANIAVPEQVAVLGVDNDSVLDALSSPPLSSIDPNASRIGYEAAAMLDGMMQGQPARETPLLVKPTRVVPRQSTDITAVQDPHLAMALTFIRQRAADGVTVNDVVRHVSISRATLERRFAEHLGRTPKEEILRVRLEQVKRLMLLTDHPLTEIARLTGFKTASHLSVLFKREAGVSPCDFRQQERSAR